MIYILINEYQKIYPYSIQKFSEDNPNISIPVNPSEESLNDHGMYEVINTPRPDYDITKNIKELDPVLVDGQWIQQWEVTDATEEEITERKYQSNVQVEYQRAEAYRLESDPLFFKSQRGEATMEEWIAKVEEIKLRYPNIV